MALFVLSEVSGVEYVFPQLNPTMVQSQPENPTARIASPTSHSRRCVDVVTSSTPGRTISLSFAHDDGGVGLRSKNGDAPSGGSGCLDNRASDLATIPEGRSGTGLPSHHRGDAVGTEAAYHPPGDSLWPARTVVSDLWGDFGESGWSLPTIGKGRDPWPPRGSNTGTGCRQSDRNALCAGLERRVSEKVVRSTQPDAPQSSSPPAVKPIWRPRSRDPSPSRSAHRIAPEPRKPPGAAVGPELLWSRPGWCTRWRLTPSISAISVSPRRQDFLARWTLSHRGSSS